MKAGGWLLVACVGSATGSLQAGAQQTCNTGGAHPAAESSQSRFQDHGDGTVTDLRSRLMWMRCSVGQAWSGAGCAGGVAAHRFDSARAAAAEVNGRGTYFYNDWRVPRISELATIAEPGCERPRIDAALFPGTPAGFYWTSSSRPVNGAEGFAFALSFGADGVRYQAKDETSHVRLVRSAQQ